MDFSPVGWYDQSQGTYYSSVSGGNIPKKTENHEPIFGGPKPMFGGPKLMFGGPKPMFEDLKNLKNLIYKPDSELNYGPQKQMVEKPKMKLGLPVPPQELPPLQFKSLLKELPMPGPNRFFTPLPDNREFIKNDMKKQMQWLRDERLNPDHIERR